MPINYVHGIQFEYNEIRNSVGVFDVSHMGKIQIIGQNSINLINKITVNNATILKSNEAQYSAICNDNGGIIDDIILYKLSDEKFMLIVNANNCNKVYNWINSENSYNCIVTDESSEFSLIAVQGPLSRKFLEEILNDTIDMKFYTHKYYSYKKRNFLISRTGYTGELGFELMGSHDIINELWDLLINKGICPCGLAARDILRLEMKYCLYGNDINEEISPIEAGLGWIVKNKSNYIGSKIISKHKNNGVIKRLLCIQMIDKCIPRTGYKIYTDDKQIGEVTSGTFSPGLNSGIALAYIDQHHSNAKSINMKIRGKRLNGIIVSSPFIKSTSLYN